MTLPHIFFRLVHRTILLCCLMISQIALANPASQITHNPTNEVVSGQRIFVEATIEDPEGVSVARAYFKHVSGADFMFVPMENVSGMSYRAQLPAPTVANSSMEYLFLVKNNANQVYKTQRFTVSIIQGAETAQNLAKISVFSEIDELPKSIPGFDDNLTLDVVESGAKYGIVAQLISSNTSASVAAGSATSLVNSGTVTAVTSNTNVLAGAGVSSGATSSTAATSTAAAATAGGGISTAAVVGGVAALGGVAAAAGGGGSDDGGSPNPPPIDPPPSPPNFSGNYTVELSGGLFENFAGNCLSGATLRFTNVQLTVANSTITLDFGTGTMTGTFNTANNVAAITEGMLDIAPGTAGFDTTDQLNYDSFSAAFNSETSFTTDDFIITTSEFGVPECSYDVSMTGSR